MQLSRQEVMRTHPHVRHALHRSCASRNMDASAPSLPFPVGAVAFEVDDQTNHPSNGVKCLSGSLTATAYEKLRLSVLALFLGLLLLLTGRPAQPLLYSIFRIGTDLALASRYRF
jgi:hypothetical protein